MRFASRQPDQRGYDDRPGRERQGDDHPHSSGADHAAWRSSEPSAASASVISSSASGAARSSAALIAAGARSFKFAAEQTSFSPDDGCTGSPAQRKVDDQLLTNRERVRRLKRQAQYREVLDDHSGAGIVQNRSEPQRSSRRVSAVRPEFERPLKFCRDVHKTCLALSDNQSGRVNEVLIRFQQRRTAKCASQCGTFFLGRKSCRIAR